MKKILLCVATLMAFVAGVNAQSLYSITQSEKKEADKIRAQAIDEISKKSLTKEARKKADEAVRKKLIEQKTAKNRKNDNSSSETESVFNVNTKD